MSQGAMRDIRVATVQFQHAAGDKAYNFGRIRHFVTEAARAARARGAGWVCVDLPPASLAQGQALPRAALGPRPAGPSKRRTSARPDTLAGCSATGFWTPRT